MLHTMEPDFRCHKHDETRVRHVEFTASEQGGPQVDVTFDCGCIASATAEMEFFRTEPDKPLVRYRTSWRIDLPSPV